MPIAMGRNLINLCFVKIKSPLAIVHSSSSAPNSGNPDVQDLPRATKNSSTRPCPNTFSSMLVKNFNSLYDNNFDYASKSLTNTSSDLSNTSTATASTSSHEPDPDPEPADFATVFASNRFFFSSPGRSNSIIESSNSSIDCCIYSSSSSSMEVTLPGRNENNHDKLVIDNSMAVPTYSPDPYADFLRSMQEMVEAHASTESSVDVKFNWKFLHELLLCYLALNPQHTHKFIVRAFADLLLSLTASKAKAADDGVPADQEGRGRMT